MSVEGVIRDAQRDLLAAGLDGSFVVRDLNLGHEISVDPDVWYPAASLAKVPLALVTLDRIRRGELDGSTPHTVQPSSVRQGPTGLSRFRHPVTMALDDLVYLSTSMSDNTAADLLFTLTPPEQVQAGLRAFGLTGINVRTRIDSLTDTPAERLPKHQLHLAHSLAIGARTSTGGHQVEQLDITRASAGSAHGYADLLQALWRPSAIDQGVAERVRELMGANVLRQRLAPDFSSDTTRWASKTGTLLNLRHEFGVVEHADGSAYAVVALTASNVAAAHQPHAEICMGRVARKLRDHLRRTPFA